MGHRVVHHNHTHPGDSVAPVSRTDKVTGDRRKFAPRRSGVAAAICVNVMLWITGVYGDDTIPIWQLTAGQSFSVLSTTHRMTEIEVDEHRDVSDVTDRMTLQYTMFGYGQPGIARFAVRIKSLDRTIADASGEKTTQALTIEKAFKVPAIAVLVGDHGNDVKVLANESLFRADVRPTHRVLAEICSAEILQSWFNLPFLVPVAIGSPKFRPPAGLQPVDKAADTEQTEPDPELALRSDSGWARRQFISLGLPGKVQCDCSYSVQAIDDLEARLAMTGTLRLVPHESNEEVSLRFEDFKLTETNMAGEGTISMSEVTGLPQSIELIQKLTLEGQSSVESGGAAHEFRFKQSLTQTAIASEFEMQGVQRGLPIR